MQAEAPEDQAALWNGTAGHACFLRFRPEGRLQSSPVKGYVTGYGWPQQAQKLRARSPLICRAGWGAPFRERN